MTQLSFNLDTFTHAYHSRGFSPLFWSKKCFQWWKPSECRFTHSSWDKLTVSFGQWSELVLYSVSNYDFKFKFRVITYVGVCRLNFIWSGFGVYITLSFPIFLRYDKTPQIKTSTLTCESISSTAFNTSILVRFPIAVSKMISHTTIMFWNLLRMPSSNNRCFIELQSWIHDRFTFNSW